MKSFAKSKHPHSTKQVFVICHVMGKLLFFVHSSKCVCVCISRSEKELFHCYFIHFLTQIVGRLILL